MTEYLVAVTTVALVNHLALARNPSLKGAACMGALTTVVTLKASVLAYLLYHAFLVPYHIEAAWVPLFLLCAAFCAAILGKLSPDGTGTLPAFVQSHWTLALFNTSVFGVTLNGVNMGFSAMLVNAFAAAVIFAVALVALTAIRARLDENAMPRPVKGLPALLLTVALISMVLMAFHGL